MIFVAIKIGRRQESGTGVSARHFRFKSDGRDARPTPQPPAYFDRNPSGRGRLAVFPRCSLPHVSISDTLVVNTSPARTALKNSQLTPRPRGENHMISGTGH
jgi:hypothetical protein